MILLLLYRNSSFVYVKKNPETLRGWGSRAQTTYLEQGNQANKFVFSIYVCMICMYVL